MVDVYSPVLTHQGYFSCRAGNLGTLAVKGVSGLYISDLSVLMQSLDVPMFLP